MNKRETSKLYRRAVAKWGYELQLGMLMEECAELIKSTHKIIRTAKIRRDTKDIWNCFAEEIADVEIMIDQLKTVTTWQNLREKVEQIKESKLYRLKEMLK